LAGPTFHTHFASVTVGLGVDQVGGTPSGAPAAVVLPTETGLATHASVVLLLGAHAGLGISYASAQSRRNQFSTTVVTLRLGKLR
jgi:hypothetical protein